MIPLQMLQKAWAILEPPARRRALRVLAVILATGLFTAVMVGSILPFLSVLADESIITRAPALTWLYEQGGFTSGKQFALWLGVGSLVLILMATAAQIVRAFMIASFSAQQNKNISTRLFSNYLRQPYLFFVDRHTGDLGTHILVQSNQVVDQFLKPAAEVVAAICTSLAIIFLLLWVSPVVTLVCTAALGGIYGLTFALTRRKIARLSHSGYSASKARNRICIEAIGGIKAIKVLTREESYIDRFEIPSKDLAHAQTVTNVTMEIPNYVLQALAFGGVVTLALFLLGSEQGSTADALGNLLPTIGLIAFAGQRLLPEWQRIYAGLTQIQSGLIAVDVVYRDLFETQDGAVLRKVSGARIPLNETLEFDAVTFHYPNAEQAGLFDLSVRIGAGERIGVVGTTGAGKSTLADVLLGLILPTSGRLIVDDTPIDANSVTRWQKSLGYVPQDIFLTDASIAENVALGCLPKEIDMARVKNACQIAQLDQLIENDLPNGYDSKVGERGVRLSGGQRQRIGIARAIYHDSDLLVFDEATSALDTVTEQEVMSAINALPGAKTVVLIAHRLSTVRSCDKIIVLDNGRLVAEGPWDTLIETSTHFRALVEGQKSLRT